MRAPAKPSQATTSAASFSRGTRSAGSTALEGGSVALASSAQADLAAVDPVAQSSPAEQSTPRHAASASLAARPECAVRLIVRGWSLGSGRTFTRDRFYRRGVVRG
jgi:hypothetical protein